MRQVLGQPCLALRKRLRMGCHHLDVLGRVAGAQQVVADQQAHLAHQMAGRVQQHVERAGDHAFGGVLDADHAVLRTARSGGVEDLFETVAVQQIGGAAKVLDGRFFAEGACRAEHGHALRRFQGQAGRHDLAPDGGHVGGFQRAGVGCLDLLDDLGHAVGAEECRAFELLDLAHAFSHQCALVEQGEELLVDVVDLYAQTGEVG
ncbi:hypothetical protein SDC9_111152 [bioreactor metagenome]|uniref:Uncharacterized protein n=1 Tax=bioreactor metagenome TaxID=1076179 RepID=A0A645BGI4_9ZZZZ